MRIGMMVDVYKPHISGITNYVSLNKRYIEQEGHEVYIFTFGDLDHADDETRVVRSPGLPIVDTGYYLNFSHSRKVKTLIQSMDLVHVHHPFLSGRLALRYTRPMRIPVVFTNHTRYDLYAQTYLPLLPEGVSETFLQAYMPPFCAGVDLVISPSAGMAGVLRSLGVNCPIEIVPNGVELKRFRQACDDCRAEFGFTANDILLVYSGRLAPEKNLGFLLHAFAGTTEAVDNLHLIVLGSGPEEETLKMRAAELGITHQVHFTGLIEYNDIPRYLAMCDLFVTASVTEVHPLSVIEAMATGLPVVGVRSVGVGDTVEDGVTGFLSNNDQAAYAAKLTRLCIEKTMRKKMGAAARKASEKFAIEHTTKTMLDHYEQLVSDAGPRKRRIRYRVRSLLEKYHQ